MLVRNLVWKCQFTEPSPLFQYMHPSGDPYQNGPECYEKTDLFIAAYPSPAVQFIVWITADNCHFSAVTLTRTFAMPYFDLRSRPQMPLSDMAKNIMVHGEEVTNPGCALLKAVAEFPPVQALPVNELEATA